MEKPQLQLHEEPSKVLQTDFSAGSGNALQACVASLFHLQLEDTPNFVTLPSYEQGIQDFVQPRYQASKSKPPASNSQALCILRGKSPRGDFAHVVVARCRDDGNFDFVWDPHPDATFLDQEEPFGWYMTFYEK